MKTKYYLRADWQDDWTEVSLEKFVEAEQVAGFRNKAGGLTATGGFSNGSVHGRVKYIEEDEEENG